MRFAGLILAASAVTFSAGTAAAQYVVIDRPAVYASESDFDTARDAYDDRRDYQRDLRERRRDYVRDQQARGEDYRRNRRDAWRDQAEDARDRGLRAYGRGDCTVVERRRENWDGSVTVRRIPVCD